MKRIAIIVATACLAAVACDGAWEDMTPWSLGPPCGSTVTYVVRDGAFRMDQVEDIHDAVRIVNTWVGLDVRWGGFVQWGTGSPEHAEHTLIFEKRAAVPEAPFVWYGWPDFDSQRQYVGRARVWAGPDPSQDALPTRVTPGYDTGPTYLGKLTHETAHAIGGVGDMYNNPEGNHPGLLMGDGVNHFSALALGDVVGLLEKGCRPDKAQVIATLRAQYG